MPLSSVSELLDALARHGFARDPAQRLRAERVAATVGAGRPLAELKPLLAPVLAQSEDELERFRRVFDALVEPPERGTLSVPIFRKTEPERRRTEVRAPPPAWPLLAGALALTLAAAAGLPMLEKRIGLDLGDRGVPEVEAPADTAPAADTVAEDTAAPPMLEEEPAMASTESLPVLEPEAVAASEPPGGARLWEILRLFATLLPVALFLAHEAWRRIFLRPVVMRGPEAVSPFALRAPPPPRPGFPWDPEEVRRTARVAARRQAADTLEFSPARSVAATVAAGGYPTIRYTAHTRPSEYLFLIERRGVRDQQAAYFAELADRLRAEGVLAARYFFDADPRLCYPEGGARGVGLAELFREHPGHRLFLCCDGSALADPLTGELLPWTRALSAWADRAVLTPEPVGRWGLREGFLATELPVFPATLAGVREAVEFMQMEADQDWYHWWERHQAPPAPDPPVAMEAAALRAYLGERAFHWQCAAAVYPEVHWRLTLLLGTLAEPADADQEDVEADLLRLAALPWLRRGFIANADREWMLDALGDAREAQAREAILRVLDGLERAPRARRTARMELDRTVQQLFLHGSRVRGRLPLIRRLRKLPRSALLQDAAVVRMLNGRARSRLQLPLPKRLRNALFRHGFPALGVRTWALGVGAVALAAALRFAAPWPAPPLPLQILSFSGSPGHALTLPESVTLPGEGLVAVRWTTSDSSVVRLAGTRVTLADAVGDTAVLEAAAGPRRGRIQAMVAGAEVPTAVVGDRLASRSPARLAFVLPVQGQPEWWSCDSTVAAVDLDGRVRASGRGQTMLIGIDAAHAELGTVRVTDPALPASLPAAPIPQAEVEADLRRLSDAGRFENEDLARLLCAVLSQQLGDSLSVRIWPLLLGGGASIGSFDSTETAAQDTTRTASADSPRTPAPDTTALRILASTSYPVIGRPVRLSVRGVRTVDEWTSSDERVATVGRGGVLTGLSEGAVRVTARAGGRVGSRTFTVVRAAVPTTRPAVDSARAPVLEPPEVGLRPQTPNAGSPESVGNEAFRDGYPGRARDAYSQVTTRDIEQRRSKILTAVALSREGRWGDAYEVLGDTTLLRGANTATRIEACAVQRMMSRLGRAECQFPQQDDPRYVGLVAMLQGIARNDSVEGGFTRAPGAPPGTSFRILSRFEPTANGLRTWSRQADGSWVEESGDGVAGFRYRVAGSGRVGGVDGTIFENTSDAGTVVFEVFVPNASSGPDDPPARYRSKGDEAWRYLGPVLDRISPIARF